ncbi:uncharacterized protein LOC108148301 [Drosophila elegans]|uniref:uncharacterized protein LOC108148301 n=1 Tax=Drosophila elegans TaxID=30023 RepID=UPI0007E6073B|nr:uncharacterized protein LOC108148301 [Drosophila elegans]
MAHKLVYDNDLIHITADQDEFIKINQDQEDFNASEEGTSSDIHVFVNKEDEPHAQDSNAAQGDFAVLMAAIETFTAQGEESSGDSLTSQPPAPADAYSEGFFAQEGDAVEFGHEVYNVLIADSTFPEEVSEVSRLIRYPRQNIVYQAFSPPSIPGLLSGHGDRPNGFQQNCFGLDMTDVACTLLNSAAAQLDPPVHVDEFTVRTIAHGLSTAMDFTSTEGTPLIGRRGVGRLVAALILDRESGILLAYAVAQLVPQALVDSETGQVMGMMLHQVTRGFGIDDICRRIITENTGPVLLVVNQIPN